MNKKQDGFTLVELMVTLVIFGIVAPMIAEMMMKPLIAQRKALNFGQAEAQAVTYAAGNEQKPVTTPVPDNCELSDLNDGAYTITCTVGARTMLQRVSRSFRLQTEETSTGPSRKPGPYTPGIFCPPWDSDGTKSYDNNHNVNCNPNYPV